MVVELGVRKKSVAVVHVSNDYHNILQTFRRASLYQIDASRVLYLHAQDIKKFETIIMRDASLVYFVDMAVWHAAFLDGAAKLVMLAHGKKQFVRTDMFSLSLPRITPALSDSVKFLDFLPLVSLHHYTPPYMFATTLNLMDENVISPYHSLLKKTDKLGITCRMRSAAQ